MNNQSYGGGGKLDYPLDSITESIVNKRTKHDGIQPPPTTASAEVGYLEENLSLERHQPLTTSTTTENISELGAITHIGKCIISLLSFTSNTHTHTPSYH